MKRVMIKYRVHNEKYERFLIKLEKFTNMIKTNDSNILEYKVFQSPNKYSFVHYISYTNTEGEENHLNERYVKRFNKKIMEYSIDEPVYIELNSYGQAEGLISNLNIKESQINFTKLDN